jgi:hypothetical protein
LSTILRIPTEVWVLTGKYPLAERM